MTLEEQKTIIGDTAWYDAMQSKAQEVRHQMASIGFMVTGGWIVTQVQEVPVRFQILSAEDIRLQAGAIPSGDGTPLNWDEPIYDWIFPAAWVSPAETPPIP